ncbi:MAG: Ig-like domain-containing protein [Spirochaetales bacterium]|nr:Ig-like domain-containing protein [Spirochaetales bacterium]
MGRRVRGARFALIAGAALGVLALGLSLGLSSCGGEFDLLEAITTEVKVANDKFLQVVSVDPVNGVDLVAQSKRIGVIFDRDLDRNTVIQANVLFSPVLPNPWSFEYNDITDTLYIYPDPSLTEWTDYTITLKSGLKGVDGSELQSDYSWSFKTGVSAAGNFFMEGLNDAFADDGTEDLYTNSLDGTVTLYLYDVNYVTEIMKWGWSEAAVLSPSGWSDYDAGVTDQIAPVPLQDGALVEDGSKTIYMGFGDGSTLPSASELKMRTIVLDRVAPSVSASNRTFNASTSFPARVYAITSDDRSGIESWEWAKTGGTGTVTFSDPGIEDAWVASVSQDGTYTLELDVEDRAGNERADTMSLTVDRAYPTAPSITVPDPDPYYATRDTTPTWAWVSTAGDGSGTYYFHLDSAGEDKEDVTSFTPGTALSYGTHTLHVRESDTAGNLSAYAVAPIAVSTVIPPDRYDSTPKDTRFEWPQYSRAIAYDLYGWPAGGHPVKVATVNTGNSFQPDEPLPAGVLYYWYYTAKSLTSVLYTSPTYRFTTAK